VHRPLVPIFACVACGIAFVEYLPAVGSFALVGAVVFLAAALVLLLAGKGAAARSALILLAVAALSGANYYRLRWLQSADEVARLSIKPGSRLKLFGRIVKGRQTRTFRRWDGFASERSYAVMAVSELEAGGKRFDASGRVSVSYEGRAPNLEKGDRVVARGVFFPLRGASNPGQFDYGLALARSGLSGSLYTRTPQHIVLLRKGPWWHPRRLVGAMRAWAGRSLRLMLADEEKLTLGRCLIIGDRSALAAVQRDRLSAAGIYHFVVVSGLHLAVVAAIFWIPLTLAGVRDGTQILVVVTVIVLYSMITGLRPPVVRAALMALAACGALLVRRPYDSLSAVSLAGVLILAVHPADLFGAGFQLSFLAVFSLILFTPLLERLVRSAKPKDPLKALIWRKKIGRWKPLRPLLRLLCAAVAVWIGLFPLLAYHFNLVSLGSIIGNVVLVPLLFFVLAAGLAGLLATSLCGALTPVFGAPLGAALGAFASIAHLLYRADFLYWYIPDVGLAGLAGGYFVVLAAWLALRGTARKTFAPAALAAGLILIALAWKSPRSSRPEVTVLDVRAGLSAVVRSRDGWTCVFDCGTNSRMHVARNIVAPALWAMGVRRIDELVLSHNDMDHISGAPALVALVRPKRLRVSPNFFERRIGEALLEEHVSSVKPEMCSAPQRLHEHDGFSLRVLFPPANFRARTRNNGSLALEVTGGARRVLIFGDQKQQAIDRLADNAELRCDAVVLPHHGRISAESLRKLLDATRARIAVISGTGPDIVRETVSILDARGVRWYGTWRDGAVRLVLDDDGVTVRCHGIKGVYSLFPN